MPERRDPVDVLFECLEAADEKGRPLWDVRQRAAVRLTVLGERGIRIPRKDKERGTWRYDEPEE